MKQKGIKKQHILHTGILLALLVLEVIWVTRGGYLYGNKIDWNVQHVELPSYMRQLFYRTGKLFPDFAMNLGMGQNIYYIAYYGLFSPIVLFSYLLPFVPMITYMQAASVVMAALSIVLIYRWLLKHLPAGEAFAASLMFTLAVPVMYHSHHHLMFVNYLPFLILAMEGVEKLVTEGRKLQLVLSTLCVILCSYFFSVGAFIALGLYWIFLELDASVRLSENRLIPVKIFLKKLLRFIGVMILPVLMSAVLWLPVLFVMLHGRASTTTAISLKDLLIPAFQSESVLYQPDGLGLSAAFVPAVCAWIISRKKSARFAGICFAALMSFGIFTYILNGGMYIDGKALIPFLPFAALIFGKFLEDTVQNRYSFRKFMAAAAIAGIFAFFTWKGTSGERTFFLADFLLSLAVIYVLYRRKTRTRIDAGPVVAMLLPALIVSAAANTGDNLLNRSENWRAVYSSDASALVKKATAKEKGLVRTDLFYQPYSTANYVLTPGQMRTSIYSSLNNRAWHTFYYQKAGNEISGHSNASVKPTKNLMNALLTGTKYMISYKDRKMLPGYKAIAKSGKLALYENDDAVPFGYISNSSDAVFTPKRTLLSASALKKSLENCPGVTEKDGRLTVLIRHKTRISIPIRPSSETRIFTIQMNVDNSAYRTAQKVSSRNGEIHIWINGIKNVLSSPNWKYANHNSRFTFTPVIRSGTDHLNLTLGRGYYTLSDFSIASWPYRQYKNWRRTLSEWVPKETSDNTLTGTIKARTGGEMIVNMPYDRGFTVTVDGKETPYREAKNAMLTFPVSKGTHTVKIVFHAPMKKAGIILTLIGWAAFLFSYAKRRLFTPDFRHHHHIIQSEDYNMKENTLIKKVYALAAKYREILSYLIVGALTTAVSLGSYYLCIYTVFDPANPLLLQAANIISWILAVTFAYVTNRKYVFLSKDPHIGREMASFYAGRLSTLLLDMGFMALFVSLLGFNASVMKLLGQVIITIVNYLVSKKLVFRKKTAPAERGDRQPA